MASQMGAMKKNESVARVTQEDGGEEQVAYANNNFNSNFNNNSNYRPPHQRHFNNANQAPHFHPGLRQDNNNTNNALSYSNKNNGVYGPGASGSSGHHHQQQSFPQQKPSLEDNLNSFITEVRGKFKASDERLSNLETHSATMGASMKNLEMQIGQIAQSLKNKPSSSSFPFPSDTLSNPKQCNAITLRSGKSVEKEGEAQGETEKEKSKEEESEDGATKAAPTSRPEKVIPGSISFPDNPTLRVTPLPYPQRFAKKRLDEQFSKFVDMFKKIHINIPFVEALEQIPNYAKFLKEIMAKKRKLGDVERVMLTEECSAIIQRKLPAKAKDPGSFTIPCTIGELYVEGDLCDLGASINLMPLSIFKRLNLGEVTPTSMTLQMEDRSLAYLKGIIEDVLVKVDKLYYPVDFVVLDMEEDRGTPIILGRPFLATGKANIDVETGSLTLQANEEKVVFKIFKPSEERNEEIYGEGKSIEGMNPEVEGDQKSGFEKKESQRSNMDSGTKALTMGSTQRSCKKRAPKTKAKLVSRPRKKVKNRGERLLGALLKLGGFAWKNDLDPRIHGTFALGCKKTEYKQERKFDVGEGVVEHYELRGS